MHRFRFGTDLLETCRIKFTSKNSMELEDIFYSQLEQWDASVSEISVTKMENEIVKYDVTLTTHKLITVNDYRKFFDKIDDIKSFTVIPMQ